MTLTGEVLMLVGSVLVLLSAVGVVRFDDVLARMHSLTKASTLGVLLVLLGAAVNVDRLGDRTSLVLAAGLQVLTSPVGANLIAGSAYRAERIPHRVSTLDELAAEEPGSTPDGA
jgi:multicomponent Na+:H+ antiporter subunit G